MTRRPLNRWTNLTAACVAGVLAVAAASRAAGPDASPPDVYGAEVPPGRVLPATGLDLPLGGSALGPDRTVPLAPSVQAIPSPSAFEAGCVLLSVIAIARLGRRRVAPHA